MFETPNVEATMTAFAGAIVEGEDGEKRELRTTFTIVPLTAELAAEIDGSVERHCFDGELPRQEIKAVEFALALGVQNVDIRFAPDLGGVRLSPASVSAVKVKAEKKTGDLILSFVLACDVVDCSNLVTLTEALGARVFLTCEALQQDLPLPKGRKNR